MRKSLFNPQYYQVGRDHQGLVDHTFTTSGTERPGAVVGMAAGVGGGLHKLQCVVEAGKLQLNNYEVVWDP